MRLTDSNTGMQVIEREECLRLLATKEVGRLAFVIGGSPDVLPVNYALDGDAIVVRTDSGRKLEGLTRAPVAFEVDDTDSVTRTGWSVVVRGMGQEITNADRQDVVQRMAALALEPWAGPRAHVIRIAPNSISGRRVGR